jgi:transposase
VIIRWLNDMRVAPILDAILPAPHGNRTGLTYGQLAVGYLTFVLSQCDHRLSYVEDWARQRQRVLTWQLRSPVSDKDFTDDRLEDLLRRLGDVERRPWEALDQQLGQHLMVAYALPSQAGRIDSTTVSVYHQPAQPDQTLLKFGRSKDHRPDLRQFMQQLGTLDPAGIPLISQTLAGNSAEDPHYLPAWRRMVSIVGRADWLLIADSKFSSLANQAQVQAGGGFYLAPLPLKGNVAALFRDWVLHPPKRSRRIAVEGAPAGSCKGFEVSVQQEWSDPEGNPGATAPVRWEQRMLLVWRKSFADTQVRALHERLARAEREIKALERTPPEEAEALPSAIQAILERHTVTDFMSATPRWSIRQVQQYVGAGRPGPKRQTRRVEEHRLRIDLRYRLTAIKHAEQLAGWRLSGTNASRAQLTLPQAVNLYGEQWQPERGFHRLKGQPLGVSPVFLHDEACLRGLLVLLGIALRVLTLAEFVVRRELAAHGEHVAGLYPGNPGRTTNQPTTERILNAFGGIVWYCYRVGHEWHYQISTLSKLQKHLLKLMKLPANLYAIPDWIDSG